MIFDNLENYKLLFEVEQINNNAPLMYIFIQSFVIWQLLHSSNTNRTILSSTIDKIIHISNHFWDRRRQEHVVNLRETQRASKLDKNFQKNKVNEIVLVYDEKVPRNFLEDCRSNKGITYQRFWNKMSNSENCQDQYNPQINKLFTVASTFHSWLKQNRQGSKC